MKEEKIRKFADKQANKEQTIRRFNNWVHSNPLWLLEGAGQLVRRYLVPRKSGIPIVKFFWYNCWIVPDYTPTCKNLFCWIYICIPVLYLTIRTLLSKVKFSIIEKLLCIIISLFQLREGMQWFLHLSIYKSVTVYPSCEPLKRTELSETCRYFYCNKL